MHSHIPHLPVSECKKRGVYHVSGRNFSYGVWDGEQLFMGLRAKFNYVCIASEIHHDLDQHFGTVRPLVFIEQLPDEIGMLSTVRVELKGEMVYMTYRPLFEYLEALPKRCPFPKM